MNRLCASPTFTFVVVTSPPMSKLPIERLTVTVELRRVAVGWHEEMVSAVDRDIVHAKAKRNIA